MKIVHCCFGNEHYLDTWGYQQNTLPLYHAKLGHETIVMASNDVFPIMAGEDLISTIKQKGNSYYNGLVKVRRCSSFFPRNIHLQMAKGLYDLLEEEKPDIVFFHGSLNFSILPCVRYRKKHTSTTLFVDSHADLMNVNSSRLYKCLYFGFFWTIIHHFCQRHVDKYFGVTIGRCDFLKQYFHINPSNVELLPIGADVDSTCQKEDVLKLRKRYGFDSGDLIIVHGGKLDERKGTVNLIKAYRQLRNTTCVNLKLVLFGKLEDPNIAHELGEDIVVYEWLSRQQVFELLRMADLAVWPIHHTTLIEDCVASGLPYLIRKTETTAHLLTTDFYLQKASISEISEKMDYFFNQGGREKAMEQVEVVQSKINYYTVAEKVIKIHNSIHA